MKITFITTLKPYTDLYTPIQVNAINSWLNLDMDKQILVYTEHKEETEKHFADHLDIIKVITPKRITKSNAVYVSDVFYAPYDYTEKDDILCYINSDMIMLDDFVKSVDTVLHKNDYRSNPYYISGRRWEWKDSNEYKKFHDFSDKENFLKYVESTVKKSGYMGLVFSADYFIHPRSLFEGKIPEDMILGRCVWGSWIARAAKRLQANTFDIFKTCFSIHPFHSDIDKVTVLTDVEMRKEFKLNQKHQIPNIKSVYPYKFFTKYEDGDIIIKEATK